eukprot:1442390-Prymnesium_polylepis.1
MYSGDTHPTRASARCMNGSFNIRTVAGERVHGSCVWRRARCVMAQRTVARVLRRGGWDVVHDVDFAPPGGG